MLSAYDSPKAVLYAFQVAREWIGTDVTRSKLILNSGNGHHPSYDLFGLSEWQERLGGKEEDEGELQKWLVDQLTRWRRRKKGGKTKQKKRTPTTLFQPLVWRNHYTALTVTVTPSDETKKEDVVRALLWDPDGDDHRRRYSPPPVNAVRAALERVFGTTGGALHVSGRRGAPQDAFDIFCSSWVAWYFCALAQGKGAGWRRARERQGLHTVFTFLRRAVLHRERDDFRDYMRDDRGFSEAKRVRIESLIATTRTPAAFVTALGGTRQKMTMKKKSTAAKRRKRK